MKRWLPQPRTSLVLLAVWLALNNTVHPAHLLLGGLLAGIIPLWTSRFAVSATYPKQLLTVVVLSVIVLVDILKSNLDVARLILGREAEIQPDFLWIPLEVTDTYAKTALAGIITMTPGTLSVDFSEDGKYLLVHALHVTDKAQLIKDIKARYELPLKEIFE
ncbi:MAG: Na+/H+ antiporter subunit E [Burkholderiales bacterium]